MTIATLEIGRVLEECSDLLEPHGGLVTFSAGSRVFEEGDPGDCAYMVDSGYVEVASTTTGGKTVHAVLGPGEVFGEIALIDHQARSATVTALHETTLLVISRKQLLDAVHNASPLARLVTLASIDRLRATHTRSAPGGASTDPWAELEARTGKEYERVRADSARLVRLRSELEEAIHEKQFELAYQPIVGLADGRVAGFEALIRWRRPDGSLVPPLEFIPLAEQSGLIEPLGLWVLEQGLKSLAVIEQTRGRRRPEDDEVFVSINVSPRQMDSERSVEQLAAVIENSGVDHSRVKLELTEQTLLDDPRMAILGIARLKETGVKIAIDDFGTGYSSLSYLHRFPLDILKIDRSFTQRVHENRGGQRVVSAIISLAREFEMDIVVEGIEEIGELRWLQSRDCQYGQGYLISRPIPFREAIAQLDRSFEW